MLAKKKAIHYIGQEREEDKSNFVQAVAGIAQGLGSVTTGAASIANQGKLKKMQEENNRSMLTSQILNQKAAKEAAKRKNETTLYIIAAIGGFAVLAVVVFIIIKNRK